MNANMIVADLMGAGSPFEVVRGKVLGREMSIFRNAPETVPDLFNAARRFGDAMFIVDGDLRLTYAEAYARIDAFAAWMVATHPDAAGAKVAIAMQNRADWVIAYIGLSLIGAIPVLLNSRSVGAEMAAAAAAVGVHVIFTDARRKSALQEAGWSGRVLDLDAEWPASDFQGSAAPAGVEASADDDAAILFTSGTTGDVKGVVLTHRNLVTSVMSVQLSGAMILHQMAARYGVSPDVISANRPQSANLLISPLFHVSGLSTFLGMLAVGGKVVIMRRWDPEAAIGLIASEKVTAFSAVPTMLWDMHHRAAPLGADLSSLTSVSTGGQGLPLNLLAAIGADCPQAMLGTGYGLTETSGAVAMAVGEDFLSHPQSGGRMLDLAEVRIVDEDSAVLPIGSLGEIVVRGPMVMRDYCGGGGVDADGWFHTGDIGRVDEERYVYIVDRKKDMVISGGENIYCAEVERTIGLLSYVLEVATFGVVDDRLGERLVAQIVVAPETLVDPEDVRAHVVTTLAGYKAPTEIKFQYAPLPRTGSGKINKLTLRQQWAGYEEVIR